AKNTSGNGFPEEEKAFHRNVDLLVFPVIVCYNKQVKSGRLALRFGCFAAVSRPPGKRLRQEHFLPRCLVGHPQQNHYLFPSLSGVLNRAVSRHRWWARSWSQF
ncbi:MAG: hypothetical protein VB912_00935, partial [Pirellulaceae bacterium]